MFLTIFPITNSSFFPGKLFIFCYFLLYSSRNVFLFLVFQVRHKLILWYLRGALFFSLVSFLLWYFNLLSASFCFFFTFRSLKIIFFPKLVIFNTFWLYIFTAAKPYLTLLILLRVLETFYLRFIWFNYFSKHLI